MLLMLLERRHSVGSAGLARPYRSKCREITRRCISLVPS